ncbi:hypothetical protein DSL92_03325 [Billgrantia gudaonensis]|uniref:Metal-dependent hydrolase n=1 Tax=Billgrantia gudaonensis TaxID=376427 RepID=A0A432JJU9_9GAMM|nr:hypothetical protein DSL92_03325 [Halomonas gudaonensis]
MLIDYGDAVNMTEHRGFSHSLFVLTGLATLLATFPSVSPLLPLTSHGSTGGPSSFCACSPIRCSTP